MKPNYLILFILSLFVVMLPIDSYGIDRDVPEPTWTEDFTDFNADDYYIDGESIYWNDNHDFFVLTEPRGYHHGRIYTRESFLMDYFFVEFEMRIGGGTGADGITFAWVEDYEYGDARTYYGGRIDFMEASGYAIEFDTWRNNEYNDNNDQHIGLVYNTVANHLAVWDAPHSDFIEDNEWHHVTVTNDNGHVTVTFDDETVIDHEIEEYEPFEGYFGFTAATGGATDWHCIDNIVGFSTDIGEDPGVTIVSPDGDLEWMAGETVNIDWELTGNIDHSTVYYSLDDGNTWIEIATTEGDISEYEWEIGEIFSLHARIKVSAWDEEGNEVFDVSDGRLIITTDYSTSYDLVPGWYLVSIPLIPEDPAPEAVIGDNFEHQWVVYDFAYDLGYQEPDEMAIGGGYWLAVVHDTTFMDMTGSAHTDTFVTDLTISWNLIGCPFPTNVSLWDVMVRDGNNIYSMEEAVDEHLVVPNLTGCIVQEGYFESQTLSPWFGYWFMALRADLELLIYPGDYRPVRDVPQVQGTFDDWKIEITGIFDGNEDEAFIGAHIIATDTFDVRYDFPEPPALPEDNRHISLYMEHNEWMGDLGTRFNHDIMHMLDDEEKQWNLHIDISEPGDVTLSWRDIEISTPEEGYDFTLVDPQRDMQINMNEQMEYEVSIDGTSYELIVRANAEPLGISRKERTVPEQSILGQTYPNPFNSSTTITYTLPSALDANLSIYNTSGQLIDVLVDQPMPAGQHSVVWTPTKDVGTGVYLVRIGPEMKKVVLVK